MAAGISVGEHSGRRALDHNIPLVPFIDFMVCLIAFLMVTAAWTQMSRINASGLVPGVAGLPSEPAKELHLTASAQGFELSWRQGRTLLESERVPRVAVEVAGEARFPSLSDAISRAWQAQGQHRSPADPKLDRAVLHVQNDLSFSDIVAVLDALQAPRRDKHSAFDVAFAEN